MTKGRWFLLCSRLSFLGWLILCSTCIYWAYGFYFVELTPLCWSRRALTWWVWMPATKCSSMHWRRDGIEEKNQLLTSGVWHFSFCSFCIHTIVFSVVFKVCIIRSHPCSVPQVTSSWYFPLFFLFAVIEEANWLMLQEDIQKPGDGFDAVICLGNSFAHLPDFKGIWSVTSFLFSPLKKKRRHLGFIQDHLKTNVHLCIDVLYCIFRLHTPNVKPPPQSQFIQCNVLAEHLIILVMLYCS